MRNLLSLGDTAVALSHDVVVNPDGSRAMAEHQWNTDPPLCLFTQYYLDGLAAAFRLGVERLVIIGGEEQRYKGSFPRVLRPAVIRDLLVRDHHIDTKRIVVVESEPDTIGNAHAARGWLKTSNLTPISACFTTLWHLLRASVIFEGEGVPLQFYSAESVWAGEPFSMAERAGRIQAVEAMLQSPKYRLRLLKEKRGVDAYLSGNYVRRVV